MKYFELEDSHEMLCTQCKPHTYGVYSEYLTHDDQVLTVIECDECRRILRILECWPPYAPKEGEGS